MKKFPYKKTILILAIFFLYTLFSLYVVEHTGVFIHRAMIWNLFLALLPLLFSYLFLIMVKHEKRWGAIFCFLCWLLLFPNVPYLITDFIHITPLVFYQYAQTGSYYIRDIWAWIELLHIGLGVLFGFFAGYRSLLYIHIYVKEKWNSYISWGMIIIVSLLSGFGVFLGRFLRLNSWDILQPATLAKEVHEHIDLWFSIPFTVIMALFVILSYALFYLCCYGLERYHEDTIRK